MKKSLEIWRHGGYIDEVVYSEEQLCEYIQDELQKELGFFIMIDVNWEDWQNVLLVFHTDNYDDLTNEELSHLENFGFSDDDEINTLAIKKLLNITFHYNLNL